MKYHQMAVNGARTVNGELGDQEPQKQSKWMPRSFSHREKFKKLLIHLRKGGKVLEINGVQVCCKADFKIGEGSRGTIVYIGLGKDGSEKAVKRIPEDVVQDLKENEKTILNTKNARSLNVLNYFWYEDKSNSPNDNCAYLITELCEENLQEFVKRDSKEELRKHASNIIRQMLQGLNDLHRPQPDKIFHRDLKPSNILRDVDGRWLLADFGISREVPKNVSTYETWQRGPRDWRAVESCHDAAGNFVSNDGKVKYKAKSDIQVAGMLCFYILTKGNHPFGTELNRLQNLVDGKPVGLEQLTDLSAEDLIGWMLEHEPENRPSAEEALNHPYLQSRDLQFELLVCVGNESEVKNKQSTCEVAEQLNSSTDSWKKQIRLEVLGYLCNYSPDKYDDKWTECLRLIRNVKTHWDQRPRPCPKVHYDVGEPKEYFLKTFPNLPARVHRIIRRFPTWKKKSDLKKFFSAASECSRNRVVIDEGSKQPEVERSDSKTDACLFVETFIDRVVGFLKEDVQKKLERFPWLNSYAIVPQNDKFPFVHLHVTFMRGTSESTMRDDIKNAFGEDALHFFEVNEARPEQMPMVRLLGGELGRPDKQSVPVRPAPGGGISVDRSDNFEESNPLLSPEQRSFLEDDLRVSERGSVVGTLMLFGVSHGRHYALTCYHVACDNDSVRLSVAFKDNPAQVFEHISSDASNVFSVTRLRSFRYHHRPYDENHETNQDKEGAAFDTDGVVLGKFSWGCFNAECDIVSIKIRDDLEVNCPIVETNLLYDKYYIMSEMLEGNRILVEKDGYGSGTTKGYLVRAGAFLRCDDGRPLFKNAFLVKAIDSGSPLSADSGALVSFYHNDDNKKYAFGYVVGKLTGQYWSSGNFRDCACLDHSDSDSNDRGSSDSNDDQGENLYICLDLQTALERTGLDSFCFGNCSLH